MKMKKLSNWNKIVMNRLLNFIRKNNQINRMRYQYRLNHKVQVKGYKK